MRHPDNTLRPKSGPGGAQFRDEKCYPSTRPRVDFHSADCVTLRLAEAGRAARLSGAVAEVLAAVIELLPARWSKIRDDRIRLCQLANLCPSRPHLRTVGRALRHLDRLEIIRYVPACGRGATAVIELHERFLHGVEELERDEFGSVVVPFSAPDPSLSQEEKPHQANSAADGAEAGAGPRPVEVRVHRSEIEAVMEQLPAVLAQLPRSLHWLLRREITNRLARGHRPEEVLRILAAPGPEQLQRPYKLAVWRLAQNMAGAGPRLVPLQRRWERAQRIRQERAQLAVLDQDYRQVEAVTTAAQRQELVAAMESLVGPTADPRTAVLTAVRRARRQHPGRPTTAG